MSTPAAIVTQLPEIQTKNEDAEILQPLFLQLGQILQLYLQNQIKIDHTLTREQIKKIAIDLIDEKSPELALEIKHALVAMVIKDMDCQITINAQLITGETIPVKCKLFDTVADLKAKIIEGFVNLTKAQQNSVATAGTEFDNIRDFSALTPAEITIICDTKIMKKDANILAYYKIAAGDFLVCKKNTKAEVKEKPNTALVEPKPSTHTPVANSSKAQPVVEAKGQTLTLGIIVDGVRSEHTFKAIDKVKDVKRKIEQELGHEVSLTYQGKFLDEQATLGACKIKSNANLHGIKGEKLAQNDKDAKQPPKDDMKAKEGSNNKADYGLDDNDANTEAVLQHDPASAQKRKAFITIYKALREGQSQPSIFKTDRWTDHVLFTDDVVIAKVAKYAKENPNSRTALAWDLAQKHCANVSATNDALVKAIYKGSFAESGFFKCSKVSGKAFYSSSKEFNAAIDALGAGKFAEHSQNDKNSRTHKVLEVLSPSPKMK